MDAFDLTALAHDMIDEARASTARRSGRTIHGGRDHHLRQTMVALAEGGELAEHESPGEATLQVLVGRVVLTGGEVTWESGPGGYLVIPPVRHRLDALEDAAVLLTVAVRTRGD
ncbi:cupin domain-containing protein [Pseudactinotalea suaedae]|uniref:cupin domain-containing protein n=1 Tax=Pseudactinotalea suaedae TaxID=1524924 RepID=UPI0012E19EC6|nr:cupin domain-containing protein [Pseudactinotalea suaedae]